MMLWMMHQPPRASIYSWIHPTTTVTTTTVSHLAVFASQGRLTSVGLGWPPYHRPLCADGHGDSLPWLVVSFLFPPSP